MSHVSLSSLEAVQRELVLDVIRIHQQIWKSAKTSAPNIDGKFNSQYVLRMAKSLTLPEIATLLSAGVVREKGLALLRTGDTKLGAELLRQARGVFTESQLSREAQNVAESFQSAAEAYLYYKLRQHSDARISLENAIRSCHVLRDDFGYEVEVRRVHLTRNIVRVLAAAGTSAEAIRTAVKLIAYVDENAGQWPYPDLRLSTTPDVLANEDKWFLFDQILGDVDLLTKRHDPASSSLILACDLLSSNSDIHASGDFPQVYTWIAARRALIRDDVSAFLGLAIAFFPEGPLRLRQTWDRITSDFIDVATEVAPDAITTFKYELSSIQKP